jgi:cytochrome c oxidase subunit 3
MTILSPMTSAPMPNSRYTAVRHASQFDDAQQQRDAASLGLWTFLASEIMFFGGLFIAYVVYRVAHAGEFRLGSMNEELALGTLNTFVLLTSSLSMAGAVLAAKAGNKRWLIRLLAVTWLLGAGFLGIKAFEYYQKYRAHTVPGAGFVSNGPLSHTQVFFALYFAMTGLHAVHMLIGLGLLLTLLWRSAHDEFSAHYLTPVEMVGLYWHFVDVIWVFLFPLFYLVR